MPPGDRQSRRHLCCHGCGDIVLTHLDFDRSARVPVQAFSPAGAPASG